MPNGLYITRQYVSPQAQVGGGGGSGWTGVPIQAVPFGTDGLSATSFVFTWNTTPVNGNDIWLLVASDTTISTPAGWALDASQVNSQGQYIFHKVAASEAGTVTINLAAGNIVNSGVAVWGIEFNGLPASSFDKTNQVSSLVTSSCTIPATTTLAQAAELCLASVCWNSTLSTISSHSFASQAFAYIGQVVSVGSATNIGQALGTLSVSSTTGVGTVDTFTGTTTASQGIIATYKHN